MINPTIIKAVLIDGKIWFAVNDDQVRCYAAEWMEIHTSTIAIDNELQPLYIPYGARYLEIEPGMYFEVMIY